MINFLFINKIIIILVSSFGAYLAFWVYSSDQKAKTNQAFTLMMFLAFSWITLCYFSGILIDNLKLSLFLARLAYGATILFFIPFYFFSISFIEKKEKIWFLKVFIPIGSLIIFFLSVFTNFMAKEMIPVSIIGVSTGIVPALGVGKFIYFGFVFFVTILVIVRLIKAYLYASSVKKLKLQYFLVGIVIFIITNLIFNVLLASWVGDARYYQIGNYSIIFLLGFTAYAIVKRELFDIKILLTSLFISLIAILLLLDALIFTQEFTFQIIKIGILAAFLCFGYFLIRSVLNEIKRRKELEHLALKLEKANARLKDLIEMKEEFLHITSHQLRTPLTAIRGMISMWCAGDFKKMSKKDRNEMMKRIYLSTERLNNITNDMIDAMELEGGSQMKQYNFKPVSLVKIIQEAIETLKTNFDKNNLYLNFKYPKNLPEIQGEENYLSQIFLNLIDNAQKYTSKGGVDINIKKENNFLVTEITDTGMGVSKEDEKCLFKKFSRGKRAEQFYTSGTGLGIFIAKKVIEEHNGKISVFSEGKNKGTTFKVHLPIK